ncbi:hypothetical protein HAX54_016622, partial [Datura stramonium]|nr:hypothetical protein [Datura stramonium]
VWRVVACIQHLANLAEVDFLMEHLINLYSPKLFRGGVVYLIPLGRMCLINETEEDFDQRWYERFVIIPTKQLHRPTLVPFPESWRFNPYRVMPISVPNIDDWVSVILRVSSKEYRTRKFIFPSQSSRRKDH